MEIELYKGVNNPIEAAMLIGPSFGKSGLFGCDRQEAGVVLALACIVERKTPFEICRTYDIIGGKLRKKSLAIFAEFRQRGGKVKWINTGNDGKAAEVEIEFEGQIIRDKFTIEDAARAQLVKPNSNWAKTPANMLRARVLSNAISMLCPEIVAGCVDGMDEEESPYEPKQVLQPSKKQEPATSVATNIIDVQAEPDQPSQPVNIPQAQQSSAPTKFEAAADASGKPTPETLVALGEVLQPIWDQAIPWLVAKKALPEGATQIHGISFKWAKQILDQPQRFVSAVTGK